MPNTLRDCCVRCCYRHTTTCPRSWTLKELVLWRLNKRGNPLVHVRREREIFDEGFGSPSLVMVPLPGQLLEHRDGLYVLT